jgi:hypothetical protein
MSKHHETWTPLTHEELRDGASDYQSARAYAHAEAVKALDRGQPDSAVAWQKRQAFFHRAADELMRFLLQRPNHAHL